MRYRQKISAKIENRLSIRNTLLFIVAGLGIFVFLFSIAFFIFNFGFSPKSAASGSIGSVQSGYWHSGPTWNLNRLPANNEEIVISANEEVTISRDHRLENVSIKVYGTLKFFNGKLRLDDRSSILIAQEGVIISERGGSDLLRIGQTTWIGNSINDINSPSQLTSTGESQEGLLPVSLAYFKAQVLENSTVLLQWATVTETENDFFTIERSYDGKEFREIARIEGAGNSMQKLEYNYEDISSTPGMIYYRLKQTDIDGTATYFKIITTSNVVSDDLSDEKNINIIHAGPNPFKESINITYVSKLPENIEIFIRNINGKVIHSETVAPKDGQNEYIFEKAYELSAGVYIINMVRRGKSESVKMIKI